MLALRLSGALCWYWYNRSHIDEARRWVTQSLTQADDASLPRVKALAGAGRLAHIQQDSVQARALLTEALMLAHKLGERWWAAWSLHLLGRVSYFDDDAESTRAFGNLSLDLAREIEDEWLEAWALHLLGLAEHIDSNYAKARLLYEESLVIRQRIDFREGAGTIQTLLGLIDFTEGDYPSTSARLVDALEHYRGLDAGWLMGNLVAQFLALAIAVGQPERAARLWGALSALSEAVSIRPIPLVEAVLGPAVEATRRALGEDRFQAEHATGRRMSLDEVADVAMAIAHEPRSSPASVAPPASVSTAHPAGLSRREAEVLGLIARGRTTQEIAGDLVISVNTVERHITHVYQKIGARGRAEATAYALQQGLA
jgi:non-specific serine/threonine protein kinase